MDREELKRMPFPDLAALYDQAGEVLDDHAEEIAKRRGKKGKAAQEKPIPATKKDQVEDMVARDREAAE